MPKICISFEGDDVNQLRDRMIAFLVASQPHTWLELQAAGLVQAPSDPELVADAETLSDEEYDAKHSPPLKATVKKAKAAKATPPSEPEPELKFEPAVEPPPLDVLKAAVTTAVKAAQKNGGGTAAIVALLPAFKAETGLDFIANATEAHRGALFKLVGAAGLTV